MKKILIVTAICSMALSAGAQLSSSQKLYQLCKVWGYLKYHHPNNCNIRWNDLLLERVDSVVNSANNTDFNAILYRMCLKTGVTSRPSIPTVIPGDTAKNYKTAWFNDPAIDVPVRNFLDSVQAHLISNTSGCLLRANDYSDPNYISYIDFRHDSINNVPGFSYANLKHRMLVYFYYWNAVNYFFPQIQIADKSWDSTLIGLMPDMFAAGTDSSFELTLARAVSRIDDSHGSYSGRYFYKFLTGVDYTKQSIYYSRINIALVQNQHLITASGESGIHVGDIITKIDGINADTFFAKWMPYLSAGNNVTKHRDMYNVLTFGPSGGHRQLELKDVTGNTRLENMYTSSTYAQYNSWYSTSVDTLPEWSITRCGYGYVNMGKLTQADVPVMYQDLQDRPAIIFDIRNYPQGTLWNLKPLLFPNPAYSAQYFTPDLSCPGYYFTGNDLYNFGNWSNANPYAGKIIILVNEQTQSQAEYTAQALRTFPRAIIIGSQTAGADGNIVYLDLPNIRTFWTGLGWYQADWYNPQRAGVKIDSVVNVTVAGIRSGVDEVLNKAFDCRLLVSQLHPESEYSIRQQGHFLSIFSTGNTAYNFEIINALGQRLFTRENALGKTLTDTDQFPPGMYVVVITDKAGTGKREKIVLP